MLPPAVFELFLKAGARVQAKEKALGMPEGGAVMRIPGRPHSDRDYATAEQLAKAASSSQPNLARDEPAPRDQIPISIGGRSTCPNDPIPFLQAVPCSAGGLIAPKKGAF